MHILLPGDGNERSLENISLLDRAGRGRGGFGRVADPGRHGVLQGICGKARPGTARHGVSHRVGHPVRPHGLWRGAGESDTGLQGTVRRAEPLRLAAHGQFLLEPDLLQSPGLWNGPGLAGISVGADRVDDLRLPSDGPVGSLAADPLSFVGDLRGIPQLGRVGDELKYAAKYRKEERFE